MRAWSAGSAAVLAAAAVIAILRSSLLVVTVVGLSMAPGFVPGDRVLVRRRARGPLEVGRVVLLPEPGAPDQTGGRGRAGAPGFAALSERSWVIKRIAAMPGDAVPSAVRAAVGGTRVVPPGMLVVLGDNIAQSADSRLWGFMRADDVLGVVVRSLPGSHPDGLASE